MAAPARYWRLVFRSNEATSSLQRMYGFSSIRWFDAAGAELSSGLLAAAIATNAPVFNAGSYPLVSVVDANTGTSFWINYVASSYLEQATYYIQFDFGTPVLPEYALVNMPGVALAGTLLSCASMDFFIDASTDNVTYLRQAMLYRPVQTNAVDIRLPTTISVLYPFPDKSGYGGSGGIYGVVSEDGVALPNRPVILFERDTFFKIAFTTTDENGGYAFNSLNENREYMVMSYDPSGPPYKNALVWDRIAPINTKGALAPQSAFWARRCRDTALGPTFSLKEYIEGTTYNFAGSNILGQSEKRDALPGGYGFDTNLQLNESAGGALRFIKSNRTPSNTGEGLLLFPGQGLFNGVNLAGQPANYAALTFEYIFRAPASSESGLIMVWAGTRDIDDANIHTKDVNYNSACYGAGPTLEVTPLGALNVRFPLGGRNRTTVRATTSVTPGTVHHAVISFTQDNELKLYLDGALVQTTNIAASGRLWGHTLGAGSIISTTAENWDYYYTAGQYNSAIRRLNALHIMGYGNTINNATTLKNGGPGFGGAVGAVALYGRLFSAAEVTALYASWKNYDTHTVPTTQSGYLGEVEADNPLLHLRMNETITPPIRINTILGQRDFASVYEGTPQFNKAGFVTGSTSTNTSTGGLRLDRIDVAGAFTTEFFCRPSSVAGTQRLWLSRISSSTTPVMQASLSIVAGVLRLSLTDITNTVTDFTTSVVLAINTDYHIAVTYDPFNAKLFKVFVNGVQVFSSVAAVIAITGSDWLGIGVNTTGAIAAPTYSERFQGTIADFSIYNYALPAARIQAHYAARNI